MPPTNPRVALDIETISTVDEPDFSNPEHWLPFGIAVGYTDASMESPDVRVVFRSDSSIAAEGRMLDDVFDWIDDRTGPGSSPELVTYNGESYDVPILKHRAYRIDGAGCDVNATHRLYLLLKTCEHVDLMQDMIDAKSYHVSLDDALAEHDIDADTPRWMGEKVTGSDMPEMGLELISDSDSPDLRDAVRRYAASDVAPLFELHDDLRGARQVFE